MPCGFPLAQYREFLITKLMCPKDQLKLIIYFIHLRNLNLFYCQLAWPSALVLVSTMYFVFSSIAFKGF